MADAPSPWEIYHAVRDALGEAAALQLIQAAGGERFRIPHNADSSRIAARIGLPIASCLAARWPGIEVELPSRGAIDGQVRAAERKRAVAGSNVSANELARRLGISRRRVVQIRAEVREAGDRRQGRLFEK